jgi:hypothetical protein
MGRRFFARFLTRNGDVLHENDLLARTVDQALFHVYMHLGRNHKAFKYELWEYTRTARSEDKIVRRRVARAKRSDRPLNVVARLFIKGENFFRPVTAALQASWPLRTRTFARTHHEATSPLSAFTRKLWFE